MEHEFPFGTFHPEKHDYFFRISFRLGNFPVELAKRSRSTLHLDQNFREFLENGKKQGRYNYPEYTEILSWNNKHPLKQTHSILTNAAVLPSVAINTITSEIIHGVDTSCSILTGPISTFVNIYKK